MTKAGNMTQGSEWKHLLLFALPLMAGNALQQLYNTADGIIVGNYVGDAALGAVGACAPLTMLFVALAIGLANGSAVVAGQYYGAGKYREMRRTVSTAIVTMIAVGLVLSVVGVVVARPMMAGVMSVGEEYLEYAVDYFSIYAIGLVFQFAYNIFAAVLRALGDSKATLYFLIISSVANVGLDLLFVVVFHWSVAGAAIATVISQAMSAVCAAGYMLRRHEVLRFEKGEFRFHGSSAALTMKIALPSTLQQCVVSCGSLALQRIINEFGQVVPGLMAGTTAGMRVESFILIPIFSMHASLVAFTSQNVGAGRLDRVRRGRNSALGTGMVFCVCIAVIAFVLRGPLVSLFGVSQEGMRHGMTYLTILAPSLLIFCLNMTTSAVLNGAGDARFGAFATLSSFLLRCVVAYLLAYKTDLGYVAVWVSQPVGWIYSVAIVWTRYYTGGWKKKSVAHAEI